MQDHDWQKIAPDVARQILGEPKIEKPNEWRWNNKGSLVFTLETGQFYDFEQGEGGGVKWLIEQHGKNVAEFYEEFGLQKQKSFTEYNNYDFYKTGYIQLKNIYKNTLKKLG